MKKRWTTQEVILLKECYPNKGVTFCAEKLSRSKSSVKLKAFELNLKAPGIRPTTMTTKDYEQRLFEEELDFIPIEEYITSRTPILHECIAGHIWKVSPDNLLRRRAGCPACASFGFDSTKPAIFYYVKIHKNNKIYYKVGITNKSVVERLSREQDKLIEVLLEIRFDTGEQAKKHEASVLSKATPQVLPDVLNGPGATELFDYDILNLDGRFEKC